MKLEKVYEFIAFRIDKSDGGLDIVTVVSFSPALKDCGLG